MWLTSTFRKALLLSAMATEVIPAWKMSPSMHPSTNPVISNGFMLQSGTLSPFCLAPTTVAVETINRIWTGSAFASTADSSLVSYSQDFPGQWLHLVVC